MGPDGQHEIHVQQSEGWHNIIDTGFGVSSIVPLLHAMYRHQEGTTFLLQQPEVNVHPSAQADLAQMMAESPHRFVIETHSDHLIDRFRICVMEKVLAPGELRIAYFQREPECEGVVIYNISVDEDGISMELRQSTASSSWMRQTACWALVVSVSRGHVHSHHYRCKCVRKDRFCSNAAIAGLDKARTRHSGIHRRRKI